MNKTFTLLEIIALVAGVLMVTFWLINPNTLSKTPPKQNSELQDTQTFTSTFGQTKTPTTSISPQKNNTDIETNTDIYDWGTGAQILNTAEITLFEQKETTNTTTSQTTLHEYLNSLFSSTQEMQDKDFTNSTVIYTSTTNTSTKTPTQEMQDPKRIYGNTLATAIQNFDSTHFNNIEILNTFLQDRTSNSAKMALIELANDYIDFASVLNDIPRPQGFDAVGLKFIEGYTLIGNYLQKLTEKTNTEDEFLQAVLDYNRNASSIYTKNFLSLVTLFKAHGVIFEKGEPGEIFTPNFGKTF